MKKYIIIVALSYLTVNPAFADDTPSTIIQFYIPTLRDMLGKSLIDTAVTFSNERPIVLEKIVPQGATFYLSARGGKVTNENFDQLRGRSVFAVSLVTCNGAKSLDAKISNVIAWEIVQSETNSSYLGTYANTVAISLERLLGMMNSSASVTTPSTMRSPRGGQLHGLVFEYVKGDTTETISLLNEGEASSTLKVSWSATNTAYCPKF